jgi:hypothetical protein
LLFRTRYTLDKKRKLRELPTHVIKEIITKLLQEFI